MLWKKASGKNTTEMGRQHQEGLLVAAEYRMLAGTIGDRDIWRWTVEEGRDR